MPQIGIRQLKNATSEIIRSVHDDGVEYVVTHHGRPVAVIRPVDDLTRKPDEILALAADVFAGLDATTQADVEELIQRRQDFFGETVEGDDAD